MTIDTRDVDSPGWWLNRCARKLLDRQTRLQGLQDRFEGNGPLPTAVDSAKAAYQSFQRKARTNFEELTVEAVRERMTNTGWRTAAGGDENGDAEALRMFAANGGAILAADVHTSMLSLGDAYVIVGGPKESLGGAPLITAEDPRQVVTIHDPEQQSVVRAGLKLFHDPEVERDFAYLYRPGRVHVAYRDVRRTATNRSVRFSPAGWAWDESRGGIDGEELPHGRVPVVRFRNRRGVAEFEPHIDLLDRIAHQILQRMTIATMQAFRQRAIKGNLPEHDENGNPIDYDGLFVADPGAVWELPEGVDIWESGQVDLTPILGAVKADVQHYSAVTGIPLHMFNPEFAAGSAEGASLTKERLVFRAEDRIARASEGWKDVASLMFLSAGDTERADRSKIEVLWRSPERRSLTERASAASQAQDIPWRTRMKEIYGFDETTISRMETERATDALLAAALAPVLTPVPASTEA